MQEGVSLSRELYPDKTLGLLCDGLGLPSGVVDVKEREFELVVELP